MRFRPFSEHNTPDFLGLFEIRTTKKVKNGSQLRKSG